ncbi:single-stranded DNA-binding protein [Mycobacterium sp. AZCC_0083]|uniref:single-stranded DNA-binding protein n=1 Tax=Mycobacterium sp. AZCC_0083 TaxID=2735882 RepID=UPI00161D5942|nr:single-stranded DNA-binding protein [Mycobacterium sp. AZCC_0083]MBB5167154.1 single-strand DNA-binding protein [Mycobacterium sp. AZCC_0083]
MALTLPVVTIEGTLTADPTLNFTQSGKGVSNINIACNTRRKNPQTDQWEDGDTTFTRGTVWGELAENLAESVVKGDKVIAHGVLKQKDFTDKEGNKRTAYELDIESIGPSLRFATAKVTKVSKNGGGGRAPQQASGNWDDSGNDGW